MSKPFAVVADANVLIALCAKEFDKINSAETAFEDYINRGFEFFAPNVLKGIVLSPNSEAALLKRAVEIRDGYGCSRSSDGLYIALAEEPANTYDTEILTFDKGFINQAAQNANYAD